jgi:hypothetical protein
MPLRSPSRSCVPRAWLTSARRAITLMRGVLESPSSLTALVNLVKAQQAFHAKAAETLGAIVSDLEEAAVRLRVASSEAIDRTGADARRGRLQEEPLVDCAKGRREYAMRQDDVHDQ